jgi:hypothetical protein
MRDKVERADYAAQLADRFKVDSRIIREEIKRAAVNRHGALDDKRLRAAQEVTAAERQLLELMLADADVRAAIVSNLADDDFADLPTSTLFSSIVDCEQAGVEPTYERLCESLEDDGERALLTTFLVSDLAWAGGDDFDTLFRKATEAVTSLRRRRLEKQLDMIQVEIGQAERESDADRVLRLYHEKAEIKRRMLRLSSLTAAPQG